LTGDGLARRRLPRRMQVAAAAAALSGAVLFVWSVRQAGVAQVADGLRRAGAGIAVVSRNFSACT